MQQVRSWVFRAFALPTVFLLGVANTGCPSSVSSSQSTGTSNNGGGGNGGGGEGGGGGTAGTGGAGGATCVPETEICDGKDNDCNGKVDDVASLLPEGCACSDGQSQNCYAGPAGTENVGTCVAGSQTCANGAWGECAGQVVPVTEECNLLDDDCNGAADDMGTATCGVGACAAMVDKCINGQLQSCVPGQPTVETCDGLDNNCNQLTDESDPMLDANCMTGQPGVCSLGKTKCLVASLVCAPNVMPTAEICDGLDNDCNGVVDDNIPGTGGSCGTGQAGVCSAGTITCQQQGGTYQIDCFADVVASPELCDGLDNDCDGTVDQANPEGGGACDTGKLGVCQPGTLTCMNGGVTCAQNVQVGAETCNGKDDNCDGQVDEGNPGGGTACGCAGAGATACQGGAVVCVGGPVTYFSDDFKDSTKGWTLGTEWQIAPAVAGCSDPGTDTTPTADNGVAGVIIGGCSTSSVSKTVHGYYYLTSPVINTANAPAVVLSFRRWLVSDYTPYMNNTIEVYNGSAWTIIWQSGATGITDTSWQSISHNLTAYKSAAMQIRFGFNIGSTGVFSEGSWNIDDVLVASAACP